MTLSVVDAITASMSRLRDALCIAETELLPIEQAVGRVLGQDIIAFRDSPAIDVSAMDGYAMRMADVCDSTIAVVDTAAAGAAPKAMPPVAHASSEHPVDSSTLKQAIRIFTGAAVPEGAECIVPREQCSEQSDSIQLAVSADKIQLGQHIRRRGENARAGSRVLESGRMLGGPQVSSLVSFLESNQVRVHRPLQIAIINTGDELIEAGETLYDWQIRDSNGPMLVTMLGSHAWARVRRRKVQDDADATRAAIADAMGSHDVVLVTGGVSMGDTDHVPHAIRECGATILFHRLPIRPGKPILGAVGPNGELVMGLPGNPLSVAVTFRRFALPLLQHMAGITRVSVPLAIEIANPDSKTLDLTWFRLVTRDAAGRATLVRSQGSGDIASLGASDGFVEVSPGSPSSGSWPFYDWMG